MSDNVRFHSKWHGKNHHTLPTPGYYDSARDPIAGPGQEFMGDFYLSGAFVAITTPELSANLGAREITDILGLRSTVVDNSATWVQSGSPWIRNYGSNFITLSGDFTKIGIGIDPVAALSISQADDSSCISLQRSDSSLASGNKLGDIHFKGSDADKSTDLHTGATIDAQCTEAWTNSNFGTKLTFNVSDNTSSSLTQAMVIEHDGNVGVGTPRGAEPQGRLHVLDGDGGLKIEGKTSPNRVHLGGLNAANADQLITIGAGDDTALTVSENGKVVVGGVLDVSHSDMSMFTVQGDISANGELKLTGDLSVTDTVPQILLTDSDASGTPFARFQASAGTLAIGADDGDEFANSTMTLEVDNIAIATLSGGDASTIGAFGIGVVAPAYKLHVAETSTARTAISAFGAIQAGGDITAFATSDKRLKDNVINISSPIEKIQSINGVVFEWNDKAPDYLTGIDYGVIAQEIEEVLPRAVEERADSGYKAVKYEKIIPLLIEAVKDQQKQIDELKKKLTV